MFSRFPKTFILFSHRRVRTLKGFNVVEEDPDLTKSGLIVCSLCGKEVTEAWKPSTTGFVCKKCYDDYISDLGLIEGSMEYRHADDD